MRVLFLSADLGGNVPPTMAIAHELCGRGVDVEIAGLDITGTDDGSGPVAVEVSWAPRSGRDGEPQPLAPKVARIFLSRRLAAETEALIRDRQPEIVVVDCMALALIKGAHRTGVPVVVVLHTFAEYWRRTFLRGPMAGVVGALGFSPRALWDAAALRLILTDPVLDPASDDPDFTEYEWVGTTEVGQIATPPTDAPPRVIVSFSTTPLAGMRAAYRRTVEGLTGVPVEAIVTTGGSVVEKPTPAPANVEIRGFVRHADIFPGASLVIGHGGHSTTMKALAHGIPLIVMPLNPTADQSLIGDVIETNGLGRKLSSRSDPATIRRTVQELLADADTRRRASNTGDRLRAAPPGAIVAADRILRAMNT